MERQEPRFETISNMFQLCVSTIVCSNVTLVYY